MTQEDKELLLKDLCARLPYGVRGLRDYTDKVATLHSIIPNCKRPNDTTGFIELEFNDSDCCLIQAFKPYLRPMSSMTEEELKDFVRLKYKDNKVWEIVDFLKMKHDTINVLCKNKNNGDKWIFQESRWTPLETWWGIDWLNKYHFDYRGLVPLGIAIAVTEENNPYKR